MTQTKPPTATELDPVARVTARKIVIAMGVVSVALSIALSLTRTGREQISLPLVAVLASLVLALSFVYLVRAADPFGPILSRGRFQTFLVIVMAASLLNELSQWGSNSLIRDDWGAVCLGLALLLSASFRPSSEILWFTAQATVLTFSLAVLQNLDASDPITLSTVAVTAAAPAIAIGLASAAYSRSLISSLEGARIEAEADASRHEARLLAHLAESDAMGELGSLRSDVVPFLARLDRSGVMEAGDAEQAAKLASVLRGAIVDRLAQGTLSDIVGRYTDEDRASRRLDHRQSAALRALIVAVVGSGDSAADVGLEFHGGATGARGSLSFPTPERASPAGAFVPFLRMIRLVFADVEVHALEGVTIVAFSFDSRRDRAAVSWEM